MNIAMFKRLAVLTLGLAASSTQAQLATNLFIDTKAMSMGNAVTADPVGIMSIHFNPAGLTKLDGRQIQFSLQNIYLKAEYDFQVPDHYDGSGQLLDINDDPVAGQSGEATAAAYIPGFGIMPMDILPILQLPSAGMSIKPEGSRFTFANAVYAPMAAGFAKSDDDPGRYQAKKVAMQRFSYLTPSFGYQVNDEFAVGASFLFSHHALALEQDLRAPSILIAVADQLQDAFGCFNDDGTQTGNDPLVPLIALCGGKIGPYEDVGTLKVDTQESLSPSFNIGFLWEPKEWFAWGATYQSGATAHLKGTYELEYTDDFAGFFRKLQSTIFGAIGGAIFQLPSGVKKESGLVTTEQVFPQRFQTGIKLKFFEDFQFNVDLGWTDFDKWDYLELQFDRPVSFLSSAKILAPGLVTDTTLKQPLGFKSVWSPAFGFAYDMNSRVQLRAGYEPRATSIPDDAMSIQAPLGFAELYSLGMGYIWDKDSVVDFSIAFMQSKETIYADPQEENDVGPYSNSSNSLNRNCLTCTVTNPYPSLDVRTKLTIGAVGITYRTKF
ncbi:Long-chain fatty acid transport protein [Oleispira antarctica RB-8]|uniref:Long-chain fatty acid transport protein n=1 Tax=Oleispira antarctica RB-8 TaxID=698738 RepID=R4YTY1_OLEAN|nr:Long-chain fatty acid transport protein [Oleispira antarctica RB-8]